MRASINQVRTDSSVTGTYSSYGYSYPQGQQAVSNLNNVIQITETYEIVLNGDANSVVTNGTVLNSDQDSTDSGQTGDNG